MRAQDSLNNPKGNDFTQNNWPPVHPKTKLATYGENRCKGSGTRRLWPETAIRSANVKSCTTSREDTPVSVNYNS